mgnify:CR=1 FL=1
MLKTNKDKLPLTLVQAAAAPCRVRATTGNMTTDGQTLWCQGTGGITLNAQIGDPCNGWAADHLEPGVTTRHSDEAINNGYNLLSCIGNEAIVVSGDAKGAKGYVTGKHGGAEHVMVWLPQETMEKLLIEDKIAVRAQGQGMVLLDYPDILLRSMSPFLLERMNIEERGDGKLKIGVAKIIPACIMGSGLGARNSTTGDYDITLHDPVMVKEYGLEDLRFGDIVAIMDADTRYGRTFRTGAVTVGVVIHGDSYLNGHGPGVTTLMATKGPDIEVFEDKNANLKTLFGV